MRSEKQPPMRRNGSDDFQTPPEALEPLLPYLRNLVKYGSSGPVIWECAEGRGNLSEALYERGFNVVASDKYAFPDLYTKWENDGDHFLIRFEGDFLNWVPFHYDCIVTNPPFSKKQQFLERCYELDKPFALLLPITTFETAKRQELFDKYGIQVIFFDKRINFETPTGKGSGSWFASAWFCYKLNLPKDLNFEKLNK